MLFDNLVREVLELRLRFDIDLDQRLKQKKKMKTKNSFHNSKTNRLQDEPKEQQFVLKVTRDVDYEHFGLQINVEDRERLTMGLDVMEHLK